MCIRDRAQVGHHGAEHADDDHKYLILHLAPAQLGEISGGRAGKGDGGGDAGQAHNCAEDNHAALAQKRPNNGHNQLGTAHGTGILLSLIHILSRGSMPV